MIIALQIIGKYKRIIHTLGFTLLLYACNLDKVDPEYPDLAVLPKNPEVAMRDYCIRSGENLVVNVKNIGLSTSDISTTEVTFVKDNLIALEPIAKQTPVLNSKESTTLLFKIPSECFDPDCDFYITVDARNNVFETNETNNTVTDTCK